MTEQVRDLIAERGINLSVVIQSLLLAATIGFGTRIIGSIDTLTLAVGSLNTTTAVNQTHIADNKKTIDALDEELDKFKDAFNEHLLQHVAKP